MSPIPISDRFHDENETMKESISTHEARWTTVPAGTFTLILYPPLVLDYDPSQWLDRSDYRKNPPMLKNGLDSLQLPSCGLGILSHSGFFPAPDETVVLGDGRYLVASFSDLVPGEISTFYFEDEALPNFDYEKYGIPVLQVNALESEWKECRRLAEELIETIHAPLNSN
jgi:hypothetical protein